MRAFTQHTGIAAPLDQPNVDTDQIIPKGFLKRIERTGFGPFLFNDWRYRPDGSPDPAFALNAPRYAGASVLVAGRNFGCGSSREHAVWALDDYGIRAVVAPSFADIFHTNCLSNGLLPITLPEETVADLQRRIAGQEGYTLTIDLDARTVRGRDGFAARFEIDPFHRFRLMRGLDDIGLTLQHEDEIGAYEARQPAWKDTDLKESA